MRCFCVFFCAFRGFLYGFLCSPCAHSARGVLRAVYSGFFMMWLENMLAKQMRKHKRMLRAAGIETASMMSDMELDTRSDTSANSDVSALETRLLDDADTTNVDMLYLPPTHETLQKQQQQRSNNNKL